MFDFPRLGLEVVPALDINPCLGMLLMSKAGFRDSAGGF